MSSNYCTFRLAQLIYVVIYLLIVYRILRYFKRNSGDGGLLNPTGPLSVFRPSQAILCAAKNEVQAQRTPIKNPRDRHVHNSLSNVVIHMPCINIHRAGHYQLEMVPCNWMCAYLRLQWITHYT